MNIRALSFMVVVLAGLTLQLSGAEASATTTTGEKFVNGMYSAFKSVIDKGNEFWDALGQGQAKDTLVALGADTGKLADQKHTLLVSLQNHSVSPQQARDDIQEMKKTLKSMKGLLHKFSVELDAAAHPIGEDLWTKIQNADTDKVIELDRVALAVQNYHDDAAISDLNAAITDLATMQKAITCFQDSITA